jgi:predicted nuclease of predicted toxin-antitoxin system
MDIRGTRQQGIPDTALWALALAEEGMLITTDKGFTERRGDRHSGIQVVRLRQPNRHKIHNAVMLAMDDSLHGSGQDSWWSCEIKP